MSTVAPMPAFTALHRRLATLFVGLYIGLLFLSYPLAALPSHSISFAYQLVFPGMLILGLLALPLILSATTWPDRPRAILLGLFIVSVWAAYAVCTPRHLASAITLMAMVTVPWAVAIVGRETAWLSFPRVSRVLAALWATQIALGMQALVQHREAIGFAGNRNWMAAILIATAPWAFAWSERALRRRLPARGVRIGLVLLLVAVPTVILLAACASRGTGFALLALAFVFAWLPMRWYERLLFAIFLALLCVTLLVFLSRPIMHSVESDVRTPLLGRTVAMIIDHDALAASLWSAVTRSQKPLRELHDPVGVGPGNFRLVFTPYRARSTYGERAVAAAVTIHPHNEFLNVAAQIGLPAALAWLGLLLIVLRSPTWADPLTNCARLSTVAMLAHGLVDMPLVQPPTDILFLACFGLLWAPWMSTPAQPATDHRSTRLRASASYAVALIAGCAVLAFTMRDWRADMLKRSAMIAEATGKYEQAVTDNAEAARIDPSDIKAFYDAGRICLESLKQPPKAVAYLQEVVDRDPNYAHVNALFGAACLASDTPATAQPFLLRECQLYSQTPAAWQQLYNCLVITDKIGDGLRVDAGLAKLYVDRANYELSPATMHKLATAWWAAVQNGQQQAAIDNARALCQPFVTSQLDPLFYFVVGSQTWPTAFLYDSFNQLDYHYWRDLAILATVAQRLPATADQPAAEALAKLIADHIHIQPDATRFLNSEQLLQAGRGSSMSVHALAQQLADQLGFVARIEVDQKGRPEYLRLNSPKGQWRLNLFRGTTSVLPPPGKGEPPQPWCRHIPIPAFMLKNRTLGVLAHGADPDFKLPIGRLPSAQLWPLVAVDNGGKLPPINTLARSVERDEINQFYAFLQAQQAKSARPATP